MFDRKTIAQAEVVLKLCVRNGVLPMPKSVGLVEGTPYECEAWTKLAGQYLIAKAKRVKFSPDTMDFEETINDA
jgi:hypothetical protein